MSIPEVPHDIIYLILDDLCEDLHALAACALAARSFRAYAQKRLYTTIAIELCSWKSHITRDSVRELSDIFITNPLLKSHVRHLVLLLHQYGEGRKRSLLILHTLPQLRRLTVKPSRWYPMAYWDSFSRSLRNDICMLMMSPTVVDVSVIAISRFPASCLVGCPQLKGITWSTSSDQDVPKTKSVLRFSTDLPTPDGRLRHITSQATTLGQIIEAVSVSQPHPRLTLNHLEQLNVEIWSQAEILIFQSTLKLCAGSLKTLDVTLSKFPGHSYFRFFELETMHSLQSLSINLIRWSMETIIAWLQHFLSSRTSPTSTLLENFSLSLPINIDVTLWQHLDCILVQAGHLSNAHIELRLSSIIISVFVQQCIPLLVERGNISVHVDGQLAFSRNPVSLDYH